MLFGNFGSQIAAFFRIVKHSVFGTVVVFLLQREGKVILEYRNLQPKDIPFLHSALGAAITVELSASRLLLCSLPLLKAHRNCSRGPLWQGFPELPGQYFFPCFILLVSHGFPHGLVTTSPHTDRIDGSYGMQLPLARRIALPGLFLQIILWLLVYIRGAQNLEHGKVEWSFRYLDRIIQ